MLDKVLTLEISSKKHAANGVLEITLKDPSGAKLPAWTPGAHIDVHINTSDNIPLVRQYSLCSDPEDLSRYRLGILLEPESRGGSSYMHHQLQVGHHLTVSPPRNNFELASAEKYIFIAGGIGITPILPMLREATLRGSEWSLHYGGRTIDSMAFLKECQQYENDINIVPQNECGFIDLSSILANPAGNTLIYCCGPGPLLEAVENLACTWPEGALHIERFVNDQPLQKVDDSSFEIELELSGRTLTVEPHASILETVRNAGINTPSSCQEGTCGTCETFVLEGEVDHRDAVLTQQEKEESEVMMICVSRCLGKRLVLEL